MKITPRTTYRTRGGDLAHVAGFCGYDVGGEPVFWSIQGNHYTESGKLVCHDFRKDSMGNFVDDKYTIEEYSGNIDKLDHDPAWWLKVIT